MYSTIFAHTKGGPATDPTMIRHMVLNSIRHIKAKHGNRFGKLVICFDSPHSWRKDVFEFYKANRKAKRDRNDVDWREMFLIFDAIKKELVEEFPYHTLEIDNGEADDIIASFVKTHTYINPNKLILIVSDDQDFYHCHLNKRVHQWHPRKKIMRNFADTRCELLIDKVLHGDSGDGIPNVLSDDDVLATDGKRQKPMTKKKLAAILPYVWVDDKMGTLGITEDHNLSDNIVRNIHRNNTLINLRDRLITHRVRLDIQRRTAIEYNVINAAQTSRPKHNLLPYITKHKLREHMDRIQEFFIGE